MNLLYLHAHDLGRWISPCGAGVETPALRAFADRSGTRVFRNAHSAAPTCSPSRAALLTGQAPHQVGMLGLMHRGFRLKHPDAHLATHLQRCGYETALAGIQHIAPGPELKGYERRLSPEKSQSPQGQVDWPAWDKAVAEAAAKFLRSRVGERPFFLDCGFWLPHRPFPESKIDPDGVSPPPGIPDTPATRKDMGEFLTAVSHMDRCCGQVLEGLQEAGWEDDTLIIFTTDHGPAFPHYKCRLTAGGTGVALMIRSPRTEGTPSPENRSIDALVSHLDLFPTICDYLDLPAPDWNLEGKSLRPLIDGTAESIRDEAFAEVTYHAGYEPMRSVRTVSHSMIRVFDEDLSPVPANVDDSAAKDAWVDAGGLERDRERVQLFDLKLDPLEKVNVADDKCYEKVREDLESRLAAWMERTDDPLRKGPVALPGGGYANDRSHLSATIGEPKDVS